MTLLHVERLRVAYGKAQVLNDVSFDVPARGLVGIIGRNGVGKTTTLKAISGLVAYECASATLDGQPLPRDVTEIARRGVIHVPEGRQLFSSLTVEENLRVGALAAGKPATTARLAETRDALDGLGDLWKQQAGSLSGGQQQLVAIARGLVAQPRLLMVDELSLGLSPVATQRLLSLIRELVDQKDLAILMVDQNVALLREVCDTLYLLDEGRSSQVTVSDQELERLYF